MRADAPERLAEVRLGLLDLDQSRSRIKLPRDLRPKLLKLREQHVSTAITDA